MESMSVLFIILSITYIVVTIVALLYFFQMCSDVRIIKESLSKNVKGNEDAVLLLLKGKNEEAIVLIKEAFVVECLLLMDGGNAWEHECTPKIELVIEKYIANYNHVLEEINEETLMKIYSSAKEIVKLKFYSNIEEENEVGRLSDIGKLN